MIPKRLCRHITGILSLSISHIHIYIYRYIERDCADISFLETDCGDISQVSSHFGCVARLSNDISQVSFHIASLIHLSLSPHMRLFWYTSRGRLCPHITGILSRKTPSFMCLFSQLYVSFSLFPVRDYCSIPHVPSHMNQFRVRVSCSAHESCLIYF